MAVTNCLLKFDEVANFAERGENENADMFKNPDMLRRFKDILSFPEDKQEHILFAIDSMIKATKLERL